MKRIRHVVVWLLGILWLPVGAAPPPNKQALLIGIATYANAAGTTGSPARQRPEPNWPNTSADRDRVLMRQMLTEQGFRHIAEVANRDATFVGISQAVETFVDGLKPGDVVVIFYAGHGQQLTDDNGDERDGLDEAFVPYDAPASLKQQPGYRGEKHLRDDRIGQWIDRIRARIGPAGHVLLLVDSCHSGTIDRGAASGRGGMPPLQLPSSKPTANQRTNTDNGSGYREPARTKQSAAALLGKFVLITGASANEYNQETYDEQGQPIGTLTYAVSRAFRQLKSGDSYERFFEQVAAFIAGESMTQTPTLEGDRYQPLFGGAFVIPSTFFRLTDVSQVGQGLVQVAGGLVSGLFERARLAFYPAGASRGGAPLAVGHVTKSDLAHAWVALDSGQVAGGDPVQAVETERTFGRWQVTVALSPGLPAPLRQSLRQAFSDRTAIRLGEKADLRLERAGTRLRLRETGTNQIRATVPATAPNAITYLEERIVRWGQARFLRRLTLQNPHYLIHANLVPVRLDAAGERVVDTLHTLQAGVHPRFPTNVRGQLTIQNDGNTDVYVTLVEIMPDGRTEVLLPDTESTDQAGGLFIRAGQHSPPVLLRFSPPYGTEVYKFIATPQPLFLRPTIESRGTERSAEADNPLVQLFGQTYRGETPEPIPLAEGSTTTLTFKITPPMAR